MTEVHDGPAYKDSRKPVRQALRHGDSGPPAPPHRGAHHGAEKRRHGGCEEADDPREVQRSARPSADLHFGSAMEVKQAAAKQLNLLAVGEPSSFTPPRRPTPSLQTLNLRRDVCIELARRRRRAQIAARLALKRAERNSQS